MPAAQRTEEITEMYAADNTASFGALRGPKVRVFVPDGPMLISFMLRATLGTYTCANVTVVTAMGMPSKRIPMEMPVVAIRLCEVGIAEVVSFSVKKGSFVAFQ